MKARTDWFRGCPAPEEGQPQRKSSSHLGWTRTFQEWVQGSKLPESKTEQQNCPQRDLEVFKMAWISTPATLRSCQFSHFQLNHETQCQTPCVQHQRSPAMLTLNENQPKACFPKRLLLRRKCIKVESMLRRQTSPERIMRPAPQYSAQRKRSDD